MDLSTKYLGFELPHPFMAGASPLCDGIDGARRLEDAGAAALVLRSLFEEQIHQEQLATHAALETHGHSFGEATSFLPDHHEFRVGPEDYVAHVSRLKDAVAIPVMASLNGYTAGGWLDIASFLEQAGADALELNIYSVPVDPAETSEAIENRIVDMVAAVRGAVGIPLAVKLSPFFTSLANLAQRLETAGADGLILFNRFYEIDIDIDELALDSHLRLSEPSELLLRLRWLAIVSARTNVSLAVSGGVHTAVDAIKATMTGADAVQMVSSVLLKGAEHIAATKRQMADWLEEKEYDSLAQMKGSMNADRCPDPSALTRANYVHQLQTYDAKS